MFTDWSWQMWVSQICAFIGLILIVISMQQKTAKKLLWYRLAAVAIIVFGLCFLVHAPTIILGASGLIQVLLALLFVYKPTIKPQAKWAVVGLLGLSVVALNIVFWNDYLNIIAIAYGLVGLVAFMQKNAATVRKIVIPACIIGITYYLLLSLYINAIIDAIAMIGAIVGIIRLDLHKPAPNADTKETIEKEA